MEEGGSLPVLMLQTRFQSKRDAVDPLLKGNGPFQGKLGIKHEGGSPVGMLLIVSF